MTSDKRGGTSGALLAAIEAGDLPLALELAERRGCEVRDASEEEQELARRFDPALLKGCTDRLETLRGERAELSLLRSKLASLPRPKRAARFIDRRA